MNKMKKYKIELNEKQMRVVKDALELRFRIDLLQEDMLAEILATMNDLDLSPENPNHNMIFDAYIDRRAHISAVLKAVFEIASPWSFRTTDHRKRDKDSLIAEEIWMAMRYKMWEDSPNKNYYTVDSRPPMHISSEPTPTVEMIGENVK